VRPRRTHAAAGGVPQSDSIGGGIKTDLVCSRVRAGTGGNGVDVRSRSSGFHGVHQLNNVPERRSLWCCEDLPRPRAIFFLILEKPGGFGNQSSEDVHAYEKFGSRPVLNFFLDNGLHFREVFQPPVVPTTNGI